MIALLHDDTPFPAVERALRQPNGLLAAGGTLTPARLLDAYRHGIFPWFNAGEPILWWSPDPRMVLFPDEFKASRSLRKILRKKTYEIRTDTAFEQVMRSCAAPRGKQADTWIHEDMIAAYTELHRMGYAHSVEVWRPKTSFQLQVEGETMRQRANDMDSANAAPTQCGHSLSEREERPGNGSRNRLAEALTLSRRERGRLPFPPPGESWIEGWPVTCRRCTAISEQGGQHSIADELEFELAGGLYGISIGRMFYGESMFSRSADASKTALAHLAAQLHRWNFGMIDCQMNTMHLASLGAREIPRTEFIQRLQELIHYPDMSSPWKFEHEGGL